MNASTTLVPAYTPLETLLLFQSLYQYGISTATFATISELLKNNTFIKDSPSYNPGRLSPDALQNLFQQLLREELSAVASGGSSAGSASNGVSSPADASLSPNSRKRKLSSPAPSLLPLPTLEDAQRHRDKLPPLINKFYIRYRDGLIQEILQDEHNYQRQTKDYIEISKGEWDERIRRELSASSSRNGTPAPAPAVGGGNDALPGNVQPSPFTKPGPATTTVARGTSRQPTPTRPVAPVSPAKAVPAVPVSGPAHQPSPTAPSPVLNGPPRTSASPAVLSPQLPKQSPIPAPRVPAVDRRTPIPPPTVPSPSPGIVATSSPSRPTPAATSPSIGRPTPSPVSLKPGSPTLQRPPPHTSVGVGASINPQVSPLPQKPQANVDPISNGPQTSSGPRPPGTVGQRQTGGAQNPPPTPAGPPQISSTGQQSATNLQQGPRPPSQVQKTPIPYPQHPHHHPIQPAPVSASPHQVQHQQTSVAKAQTSKPTSARPPAPVLQHPQQVSSPYAPKASLASASPQLPPALTARQDSAGVKPRPAPGGPIVAGQGPQHQQHLQSQPPQQQQQQQQQQQNAPTQLKWEPVVTTGGPQHRQMSHMPHGPHPQAMQQPGLTQYAPHLGLRTPGAPSSSPPQGVVSPRLQPPRPPPPPTSTAAAAPSHTQSVLVAPSAHTQSASPIQPLQALPPQPPQLRQTQQPQQPHPPVPQQAKLQAGRPAATPPVTQSPARAPVTQQSPRPSHPQPTHPQSAQHGQRVRPQIPPVRTNAAPVSMAHFVPSPGSTPSSTTQSPAPKTAVPGSAHPPPPPPSKPPVQPPQQPVFQLQPQQPQQPQEARLQPQLQQPLQQPRLPPPKQPHHGSPVHPTKPSGTGPSPTPRPNVAHTARPGSAVPGRVRQGPNPSASATPVLPLSLPRTPLSQGRPVEPPRSGTGTKWAGFCSRSTPRPDGAALPSPRAVRISPIPDRRRTSSALRTEDTAKKPQASPLEASRDIVKQPAQQESHKEEAGKDADDEHSDDPGGGRSKPKGHGQDDGEKAARRPSRGPTKNRPVLAAVTRTRRSKSVASNADETSSAAVESASAKIKEEVSTPHIPDDTDDNTADESQQHATPSRGPSHRSRLGKRKRLETSDHPSTPSLAVAPTVPPSHVLWMRGFNKVSSSVLYQITSNRYANMFADKVKAHDAPRYYDIVTHPQDLKKIRSAISAGNKAASHSFNSLGDADQNAANVWLPWDESLVPPKGIINTEQLECELVHMFCNAIMYNPDPFRGPGSHFRNIWQRERDKRTGGVLGYTNEPDVVVKDTRKMYIDVEKLLSELRSTEKNTPPLPPGAVGIMIESHRSSAARSFVDTTSRAPSASRERSTPLEEEADELATDPDTVNREHRAKRRKV